MEYTENTISVPEHPVSVLKEIEKRETLLGSSRTFIQLFARLHESVLSIKHLFNAH